MNSLKAIEIYMICHHYLELFTHIEGFKEIESKVEIIHRFASIIDKLTDSFQLSKLGDIEVELFQVLIDYQKVVGEKKATPNFHICTELVNSCRMYGPLGVNSAFIGEGLNFTLSKTYVCSNSARYSIMYFDMCQLCDLMDLNEPLIASECIVGHYVVRKELDCIKDIKTNEVFKVASFSKDFNEITLISNTTNKTREISRSEAFEMLPCVVVKLPDEEKYIPVHYYAYQNF
ncbi:predicted protein [Naegleria gruberi]|uniref:Predicted protein n=1 Tax=Naegleria gruberi TaxID=5762 RepID=D2VPV5_NAEGR|nr:uncharacterized protein NAEGRDRAFT_71000 [Naegleria gruberi]EFC41272.1 predicted protein [Naegleria gruberi]|eukprot:XP_002674016.1 predicted protein [Naegleria gruberi strain NEG-M]